MKFTQVTQKVRKAIPLKYCGAVIVAAGNASRMGGIDKVMANLGGEPMIVDYEKSIVEFATSNPDGFAQVKDNIRILYPTPTIWNSHCIATFTEEGNKYNEVFEDPEIGQIAWEKYGFRTGVTGGNYDVSKLGINGIPQSITSTVSSLKMSMYNELISYLGGN